MIARRLIALTLVAGLAGCVPNYASVRLFGLCFPPTPNTDGSCSFAATCGALWLGDLEANVGYGPTGGTLVWPIQIDNQLPDNADRSGGTNTNTAWIEKYLIKYTDEAGLGLPDVTVEVTTFPVEAASSAVVIVPIFPLAISTNLAGALAANSSVQVKAEFKAQGHYGSGDKFETGTFTAVVQACRGTGCVASVTSTAVCPAATPTLAGACPQGGQSAIPLCQ
jgi:hypothetical protein